MSAEIRWFRPTNLQLFILLEDGSLRGAIKIENEIQQRIHEQKAALPQRVIAGNSE
jgi:hypothetical protein